MIRKAFLTGVLVTAAVVGVAGLAYAAIPASDGTISACRDSKGVLKVIDAESGATCPTNQLLLQWNEQGPAGPTGPRGPAGVSGLEQTTGSSANTTAQSKMTVASCPAGKRAIGGVAWTRRVPSSNCACRGRPPT